MSIALTPSPIALTASAKEKLIELLKAEKTPDAKLRIFAQASGCGEIQFGFLIEAMAQPNDITIQINGSIQLIVDPWSLDCLSGAEVDYKKDGETGHFVVRHLNMPSGCGGGCQGCGRHGHHGHQEE